MSAPLGPTTPNPHCRLYFTKTISNSRLHLYIPAAALSMTVVMIFVSWTVIAFILCRQFMWRRRQRRQLKLQMKGPAAALRQGRPRRNSDLPEPGDSDYRPSDAESSDGASAMLDTPLLKSAAAEDAYRDDDEEAQLNNITQSELAKESERTALTIEAQVNVPANATLVFNDEEILVNTMASSGLLPMYKTFLILQGFYTIFHFGAEFIFGYSQAPLAVEVLLSGLLVFTRIIFVDGLIFFLAREYYGSNSLKAAIVVTLVWSAFWGLILGALKATWDALNSDTDDPKSRVYALTQPDPTLSIIYACAIVSLIIFLWIAERVQRLRVYMRKIGVCPRPAFYIYSVYLFLMYVFLGLGSIFEKVDVNDCYANWTISSIFFVFSPVVAYATLRRDSLFMCMLDADVDDVDNVNWASDRQSTVHEASLARYVQHGSKARLLDFRKLKLLHHWASGAKGRVWRGVYDGHSVAVKRILCDELVRRDVIRCLKESSLMAQLDHPNVVKFFGVCPMPPDICLVSEFCELGELYGFLHRLRRPLHHSMVVSMSIDCALGLNYLHTRDPPIIWRDCKTKNYLVDANLKVMLADVGESRCIERIQHIKHSGSVSSARNIAGASVRRDWSGENPLESTASSHTSENTYFSTSVPDVDAPATKRTPVRLKQIAGPAMGGPLDVHADNADAVSVRSDATLRSFAISHGMTIGVGTLGYCAPEISVGRSDYSLSADIFGLGIVLWEILTLKDPIDTYQEEYKHEMNSFAYTGGERLPIPSTCPAPFRLLITHCWDMDPIARPMACEVVALLQNMQV